MKRANLLRRGRPLVARVLHSGLLMAKARKAKPAASGKASLVMNRSGDFRVKVSGDGHCGAVVDGSILTVRYATVVECDVDSLDESGFMFDQLKVDQFFKTVDQTLPDRSMSCERMTIWSARMLWRVIHTDNSGCIVRRISVTLSPAPFVASMTFTYSE